MPKNIVLLLDGTSNSVTAARTNILRLYGLLDKDSTQLVYYDPGVGTFGGDGAWSRYWRKTVECWGLGTGWGLDANVKEAYRFLMQHYSDEEGGDSVFIFGFSRGAYSARVLAGFLNTIGLIDPQNLNLLDYAYRAYKRIGEDGRNKAFEEVRLYERMLRPRRIAVRLLGLFDTVASVIESGKYGPRLKSHASTRTNSSVEAVLHALAIDERRTMFRPQLWKPDQFFKPNPFADHQARPQILEEVWFAGTHCDVGGGYREQASGLCKLPLAWMVERTKLWGLRFNNRNINRLLRGEDQSANYVAPNALAPMQRSMTGLWPLLECFPRRKPEGSRRPSVFGISLPLFERRSIPPGATLHVSVIERREKLGLWSANIPDKYDVRG
jgi:uncharacterized protein (DUF2235 family)